MKKFFKVLVTFVLSFGFIGLQNLNANASQRSSAYIPLDPVIINNSSNSLLVFGDDLSQDYNNIIHFPSIRLLLRGKKKKKARYEIYDVSSGARVFVSMYSSKVPRNTLYIGSFNGIDSKNLEIDLLIDGKTNTYKTTVTMINSPSSDGGNTVEGSDADLYNKCFNVNNLENYPDCLELFFRRVSFESNDEVATVVNEDGNFIVTIPSTAGPEGPIGPQGPVGPQGPQGPRGFAGDAIWNIDGNSITNNGVDGGYHFDLVFGDDEITSPGENKFVFEKTSSALRIGSTNNNEWSTRGDYSTVIGKDSTAPENGSVSIGNFNINHPAESFLIGVKNTLLKGDPIIHTSGSSVSPVFTTVNNGEKNFIFGSNNTANGGFTTITGVYNNIETRLSSVFGNSNFVDKLQDSNKYKVNSTGSLVSVGSSVFISGSSNKIHNSDIPSAAQTFVSGSENSLRSYGHEVYGSDNYISYYSSRNHLYGSNNLIYSGTRNLVHGTQNILSGSLKFTSSVTKVISERNTIFGKDNYSRNSKHGLILGDANQLACSYSVSTHCFDHSTVIGNYNRIGDWDNTASIDNSVIIGDSNKTTNSNTFALGRFTAAKAKNTMVIGTGSGYYNPLVNDSLNTLAIGFQATEPTIYITNPRSPNPDGYVGIGTDDPQRKLHISEAMRIEPQDDPPVNPSLGDIYVDSSEAVCIYASNIWNKVAGAGSCS